MSHCASGSRTAPAALAMPSGAKAPDFLVLAENACLSLVFAGLVLLPLAEIFLRAVAGLGFQGSSSLVQHLTFAVGILGAAVAARESRLLGFSAATLLEGAAARIAKLLGNAIAAAVSALLCLASVQFVESERAAGKILAHGIPVWVVESLLPLGFALITLRLIARSADRIGDRVNAGMLAAAVIAVFVALPLQPRNLAAPGLAGLLAAMLLGAPLFAVIGGAALLLLWEAGVPIASVAVNHYGLTSNPSLPAIPLFTLAGYFLAESGSPRRLIELFDALFGRHRGGAAVVTVLACTFFTSFTGASGVAILAIGGLAMPLLLAAGYPQRPALGLVTGGGLPGVLLFPALPLLLYAIVARTSIESMFVGGFLPTLLMLGIALWWGIRQAPRQAGPARPFDRERALHALWSAKWDISLPLVPLTILLGGLATPVEAAAATALYAFLIAAALHRDIHPLRDAPRIMTECGLLVGGILLILGVSLGLTNYLVDAQVPERAVEWVSKHIQSPWAFLLALNGFLLLVGCVMDIFSAIVVITPLIVPIGLAFGVHPVHLGIIFLANLEIGYLTPPIGLNLFFSSYRFGRPIPEVCRAVTPLFLALCAGVLAITYLPWLSTGLLGLVR
ncbi:MAG TPA: TRAP transporter large permease subunit [Burkholderiales bacterium]|nr:TRAP transporter large permease subunit [Burkholderiales bacterium]